MMDYIGTHKLETFERIDMVKPLQDKGHSVSAIDGALKSLTEKEAFEHKSNCPYKVI